MAFRLVDEVKSISEECSAVLGQLKQAEDTLQSLVDTRGHLEKDIVHKRKNLYLDRDRIQEVRLENNYLLVILILLSNVSWSKIVRHAPFLSNYFEGEAYVV